MNLKKKTVNELQDLRIQIDKELATRSLGPKGEFTVEFLESNRTNGTAVKPYAARITGIDETYGFTREFIDLEKTYGNQEIIVEGEFEVATGDIIEMQTGGTSKNPHRDWYAAAEGQLWRIGATDSADNKRNLKRYFQGKIRIAELVGEET